MPKRLVPPDRTDAVLSELESVIKTNIAQDLECVSFECSPSTAVREDWSRVKAALETALYTVEVLEWEDLHDGPEKRLVGGVMTRVVPKVIGHHPKLVKIGWR